jgi:hypothetical protein
LRAAEHPQEKRYPGQSGQDADRHFLGSQHKAGEQVCDQQAGCSAQDGKRDQVAVVGAPQQAGQVGDDQPDETDDPEKKAAAVVSGPPE